MDVIQQKSLNALEPFVLLSKSATSPRAAADLIIQATSAPNTFVFAELLQTPNVAALKDGPSEFAPHYSLLQIFAWGTWADYTSTRGLPQLSEFQAHKLRQLTLLSLATSPSALAYSRLQDALGLSSVRALEDLVISAIYAGLLTAKLDTLAQRVDISSVSPLRDLRPNSVPAMISTLDDWNVRCVSILSELEDQVQSVRQKAIKKRQREQRDEAVLDKLISLKDTSNDKGKAGGKRGAQEAIGGRGPFGGEGGEEMDLDQGRSGGRSKGVKRGGGGIKGAAKRMMG